MFTPTELDLERGWPGRIEGDKVVQLAAQTLQAFFTGGGAAREHAEYPLADVVLRAPVLHPPGIRVFHDGEDFAFGNTAAIYGPGDDVPYPAGSSDLRLQAAVVAVLGAEGTIGGFTAGNVWHAPDLHGAKSRDFALSIGPVVVTPDEYEDPAWTKRLAHAAHNTRLRPGELLVVPLGDSRHAEPGPVAVEIDGIGVLSNRVVAA